jgi:hypothetical protein
MSTLLTRGLLGPSGGLLTRGLGAFSSGPLHASVLEAVHAWFAEQTSLQALLSTPKLWEWEATEGTLLPYATIFEVSDVSELTTGDPLLERVAVQISLHDRTGGRAKALGNAFKAALHKAPLTVMGRPVAHCLYSNALLTKAEGKAPGGKDCHMQMLEFEIMVARPSISS